MNVIPFQPWHIREMRIQDKQALIISLLPDDFFDVARNLGPALSAEVDGRIVACAGIGVIKEYNSGTLWACLAQHSGRHFVRLDRCARRLLEIPRLRRIEATTEADFAQGRRWLELLGFQSEGIMRKYGPDGADHVRYARV